MDPKKDDKDSDLLPMLPESTSDKAFETSAQSRNSETTVSVAESLERIRHNLGISDQELVSSISLHILGVEVPLRFDNQSEVMLGRVSPTADQQPDIDLSLLPVNAVGVSRKHIRFVFRDDVWFAEDLGSRNGTWLNNKLMTAYQRYKLQDGDQVRVGNVIIIVIVTAVTPAKPSVVKADAPRLSNVLALTSSSILDNQQGIDTDFMILHLLPYLNTIIEMMRYVDKAKKRSHREISVTSIEFDNPIITIKLTCSNEALEFLRNDFRRLLVTLSTLDDTTQALSLDGVEVSDESIIKIAQKFSESYFPLLSSDQSTQYQKLIVPFLRKCSTSIIRIID